jgi:hypothetical protein
MSKDRADGGDANMIKKSSCLISLFFLLSCVVLRARAEDQVPVDKPKFAFAMNLTIGLSSYEDIAHNQAAFQKLGILPELSYGRWGLGFDLSLEFDADFSLRDLDDDGKPDGWTTLHDYITKVDYLQYGEKGDPLYGRIGTFDGYTMGHGLVMNDFSNTIYYPQIIQLGLNLDVDGRLLSFPYVGFVSVVDDVLDWDILGARLYARPFYDSQNPIFKGFELGATFVTDTDTLELPTEVPEDNPASGRVAEFGIDVEVPLLEKEGMSLVAYADWAKIVERGSGGFVGGAFTYQWLTLSGQIRFLGEEFVPAYFDSFYEEDRAGKYASLDAYTDFYMGYMIGTELDLFKVLEFSFQWEHGLHDVEGPRVLTGIGTADGALPKFAASLVYEKKDIDGIDDFFSEGDSLLRLTAGYKISPVTKILFVYEMTYSPYTLDPAHRAFVDTQFSF